MENHIKSLQIETYRGIKDLHVDNLGSVNVFVGDNNLGKASVLEAIELMCNPNMSKKGLTIQNLSLIGKVPLPL